MFFFKKYIKLTFAKTRTRNSQIVAIIVQNDVLTEGRSYVHSTVKADVFVKPGLIDILTERVFYQIDVRQCVTTQMKNGRKVMRVLKRVIVR